MADCCLWRVLPRNRNPAFLLRHLARRAVESGNVRHSRRSSRNKRNGYAAPGPAGARPARQDRHYDLRREETDYRRCDRG